MKQAQKHIVVIGGGITGLTAAYYLHKFSFKSGIPYQITLVEKSDKLGGSIQTLRRDGCIIEKGPDSFLARKPAIHRLIRDIGLKDDLVGMNPAGSKSFIYSNSRLHPMPDGLALGIPTRLKPFMGTGLLSLSGKARAALDFILPRRASTEGDESLGSLIKRRLGREVADQLVGPVLGGIYAGDLNMLSTAATFPQLQQMEAEHGSIILGMLANKRKQLAAKAPAPNQYELPPHLKGSMFLSLKRGLLSLVEELSHVPEIQGIAIQKNCSVVKLSSTGSLYHMLLSDQSSIWADGVIIAVPASQAAGILGNGLGQASGALRKIPGVSVANVAIALDQKKVPAAAIQGSGFVVPRDQGLSITACTWTSAKWTHTAPVGRALLRAYVGHWGNQSHIVQDDEELTRCVINDLQKVMGFPIDPLFLEITRHSNAMPQYVTGHLDRLERMEQELAEQCPGVMLAGGSYRGLGIPDCVQQGHDTAERLVKKLEGMQS